MKDYSLETLIYCSQCLSGFTFRAGGEQLLTSVTAEETALHSISVPCAPTSAPFWLDDSGARSRVYFSCLGASKAPEDVLH